MKNENFTICPFVNGLSDHDAQILTLKNINIPNQIHYTRTIRKINKWYSVAEFKTNLSYESWDNIFIDDDTIFNNSLNTYLRIFYSSFPLRKVQSKSSNKEWITTGIMTSYLHKRELYLISRNSNNSKLKNALQILLQDFI
jgi:hypothetical protein